MMTMMMGWGRAGYGTLLRGHTGRGGGERDGLKDEKGGLARELD